MATRSYGQYCPVARTAEIVADRWTPLIVRELLDGADGFNALQRALPGIARSVLADRLRRLEADGIMVREARENGSPVSYALTPAGQELRGVIDAMAVWGFRWAFGEPRAEELDPWLLLYWMRRRANAAGLPEQRVVVQFDFNGGWSGSYWLLIEPEDIVVCLHHPGFEIDLHVLADVATLYKVWLERMPLAVAQRANLIRLDGPPALARAFTHDWFVWTTVQGPGPGARD